MGLIFFFSFKGAEQIETSFGERQHGEINS